MFKPKKQLNENAIKKDFFSKKKKNSTEKILKIEQDVDIFNTYFVNKLKEVKLPTINKQSFVLTKMNSSFFELLDGIDPCEILIFFSRINKKQYDLIKDKNIIGMGVSLRVLEKSEDLYIELKNKCEIKFTNNHSKILLFKLNENHFVIEGSGNPSINARNEFYIIHNSKDMYNLIKKSFKDA